MAGFNDLPVELLLKIIQETIRFNKFKPIIGEDAAWTDLNVYNDSVVYIDSENIDESDPLPPSPVFIHADILSLRLTSSILNLLCIPFAFADLNILKDLRMPFEEFYDLIVKPYGQHFKTVRILISEPSLSDSKIARIINGSKNVASLMLYHRDFERPFRQYTWKFRRGSKEDVEAMEETNHAIVSSLSSGSLNSIGIYAHDLLLHKYERAYEMPSAALFSLFTLISQNADTTRSLKHLDIVLVATTPEIYDIIRKELTSMTSLTVRQAFQLWLGRIWDQNSFSKWSPNTNLTHLKLHRCANVYAPHIPSIVRHFVSLKVLLLSICGAAPGQDPIIEKPQSGWYSAPHALWKVRSPLEAFHLEHMDRWEVGVMGEIPTKTLTIANLAGIHLVRALQDDFDYYPKLETVMIEPRNRFVGGDIRQLSQEDFEWLQQFCENRSVAIVEGIDPTVRIPNHCVGDRPL